MAIADNAWDDGTHAWPSITTIANKARVSKRTASRCIAELVEMGELIVEDRIGSSNLYTVNVWGDEEKFSLMKRDMPRDLVMDEPATSTSIELFEHSVKPAVKKKVAKKPAVRQQDEVWNAVMEVCQIDQTTLNQSERTKFGGCCKLLRESQATSDEIYIRAKRYREKYKDIVLTPAALANHWSSLSQDMTQTTKQVPESWNAIAEARKQRGA
jgi:hypothetical protein